MYIDWNYASYDRTWLTLLSSKRYKSRLKISSDLALASGSKSLTQSLFFRTFMSRDDMMTVSPERKRRFYVSLSMRSFLTYSACCFRFRLGNGKGKGIVTGIVIGYIGTGTNDKEYFVNRCVVPL